MSLLEVNKITPQSGTTLTLGDSGDTINFGSGVLPNFENLTVTGDLTVDTNSLKVDSANNRVGIGTASPDRPLKIISTSSSPIIEIQGSKGSGFEFGFGIDSNGGFLQQNGNTNLRSFVNGSERMRVSNSGDLIVGKTSTDQTVAGTTLFSNGKLAPTVDSDTVIYANRETNNGGIISLRKDGTEIGILGVVSNDNLYITNPHSNTQKGIGIADDNIYPVDNTGNSTSNQLDIGDNSAKFKDLYLGGNAYASIVNINNASTQGRLNVSNNGAEQLEVFPGDVAGKVSLQAFNRSDTTYDSFRYIGLTHEFLISGTEKMRIASNGRVGIGTSSPERLLHLQSSAPEIMMKDSDDSSYNTILSNGGVLSFSTGSTEAMRIDSSGNVLVGKTSTGASSVGFEARANGFNAFTRDGSQPLEVRRLTSDGVLIDLRKDATSVGSIGVDNSDNLFISGNSTHAGFEFGSSSIVAYKNGTSPDNAISLGGGAQRFANLYLGGNIYLGGTGSANALDDYEEGSFTPGFKDQSGNVGSLSFSNAMYTKIGRVVHVSMKLSDFDTTGLTSSEDLIITGLPFTSNNANQISHSGSVRFNNTPFLTSESNMLFFNSSLGPNTTDLRITGSRNNSSAPSLEIMDVDSDSDIFLSLTYMV